MSRFPVLGVPGSALGALDYGTMQAKLRAWLAERSPLDFRQEYEGTWPPMKLCGCPDGMLAVFCLKKWRDVEFPMDMYCKREEEKCRG